MVLRPQLVTRLGRIVIVIDRTDVPWADVRRSIALASRVHLRHTPPRVLARSVMALLLGPPAPTTDAIEWTAPPACPDDAALEARIAAYVDTADGATTTQATVRAVAAGFEVELVSVIDGEPQRRTLAAPDCEVLADAVAVVVALAIDPAAGAPEPEPEPEPEPPPSGAVVLPVAPPSNLRGVRDAPPVAALDGRAWDVGFRLDGGYGSGVAPIGSGVFGLAFIVGRHRGSIEAIGRLWAPRSFDEPNGTYGARVVMGTGSLLGCLRARPGMRVEFPLCAGLEAGALSAAPRGLTDGQTQRYPWVGAVARLGMRVRLRERVGVVLALEGGAPFVRDAIDVGGADRLWTTRTASGRVLAGIDLRWLGPGTARGR